MSCGSSQYGIRQEQREGRETLVVCEQKVIRHQWQKVPVPGNHSTCGLSILTTHSHMIFSHNKINYSFFPLYI